MILNYLRPSTEHLTFDISVTDSVARSITLNYVPPLVPAVACVESMQLSEINLTVWCTLAAERFAFASYTC